MTTEKTMTVAREAVRLTVERGCGCGGASSGAAVELHSEASGCGGSCGGSCGCGSVARRERPRWFAGQLVGPRDLTDTQTWVLERMRRHNRLLHGWGVDCGLTVTPVLDTAGRPVPWQVQVGTGHALAPSGDEIVVEAATTVDVRAGEQGSAGGSPLDPWCAPVRQRRDPAATYYLAVRYDEAMTRPVRTASCGCGCDDETACEYSRIAERAAFALLEALPSAYTEQAGDRAEDRLQEALSCTASIREHGSRECPGCACSPWVVLADITVTGSGAVTIDQLAHRRFLASFGNYGFFCAPRSLGCMTVVRINRSQEGPEAALVEAFTAGNTAAVDKLVATGLGVLGTVPLTVDGPDAAAVQQVTSQVLDIVQNRVAEDSIVWLAESWPERSAPGQVVADSAATAILDGAAFAGNRQPDAVVGFTGPCGARLFIVSVPKPPPPPLGPIEVVTVIQGLELSEEADLYVAFQDGRIADMDALIARGVGRLGTLQFRSTGPDQADLDAVRAKVQAHLAQHVSSPGTVLWFDQGWIGLGGPGQVAAVAAATRLLDESGLPAGHRIPPEVKDFTGSGPVRLIIRTSPIIIP
jgi:hypothetical protein